MTHKLRLCEKFLALRALKVAFIFMNFHMFVKVASLGKWLTAPVNWAHKRLLLSMRSQVVKKIVPLLKRFCAVIVLTKEYLNPSFTVFFVVFDIFESFYRWYVQIL